MSVSTNGGSAWRTAPVSVLVRTRVASAGDSHWPGSQWIAYRPQIMAIEGLQPPRGLNLNDAPLFAALPLPATLVDEAGMIIDVNEAFLEYAATRGRPIQREDRIGRPIGEFAFNQVERSRLASYLRRLFVARQLVEEHHVSVEDGVRHIELAGSIAEFDGQRLALIIRRDRTEQVESQARRDALGDLRRSIWAMASPDDIDTVIRAIRDTLLKCGVDFYGCGVNILDEERDPPSVRVYAMQTGRADRWKEEESGAVDLVQGFVREGHTVYRRDLLAVDDFAEMPRLHRQEQVRSVLDVPFAHGTLAVNSLQADAFSVTDVALIEEMAQILADTLARAQDLAREEEASGSLLSTELRYRALFHGASDAVVTFARAAGIVEANQAAANAIGCGVSDLIGRRAVDIIHPGYWRRAIVTWQRQMREVGRVSLETVVVKRDGTSVPVTVDGSSVRLSDGSELFVIIARDISERHRLEELRREFARQSERLQEEQRRQIARSLHDGVNQVLSAAATRLHLAAADSPPSEDLTMARELLDQTILEVRRISRDLRPTVLDDLGLLPALRSLGKRFQDEEGVEYILRAPDSLTLAPEVESVIYRIVQESLTNVSRHARARRVQVEVHREGQMLLVRVVDDGIGFDAAIIDTDSGSVGLRHLRERAQMLRGRVSIYTAPGAGTTVAIRLPLEGSPAAPGEVS